MRLVNDYLAERYLEGLSIDWNAYLKDYGLTCYMTTGGFVTYKLQGDAAIIYDMYVAPAFRNHTYSWQLHDVVLAKAEKAGKRVMITFSEYMGKNHMAGITAIQIAGFKPAFKTNEEFVFIKGI